MTFLSSKIIEPPFYFWNTNQYQMILFEKKCSLWIYIFSKSAKTQKKTSCVVHLFRKCVFNAEWKNRREQKKKNACKKIFLLMVSKKGFRPMHTQWGFAIYAHTIGFSNYMNTEWYMICYTIIRTLPLDSIISRMPCYNILSYVMYDGRCGNLSDVK